MVDHIKVPRITDPILVYRADRSPRAQSTRKSFRRYYRDNKAKILANKRRWRASLSPSDLQWERLRAEFRKHRGGKLSAKLLRPIVERNAKSSSWLAAHEAKVLAKIKNLSPAAKIRALSHWHEQRARYVQRASMHVQRLKDSKQAQLTSAVVAKFGSVHKPLARDPYFAGN